ncbi:outer membrane protein [Roseicyclus amphidinii]|uniref:outer membrane protein n=1 Tax=Roseicyclus amphidinii TaxID=3034232 RepID=UPI0024E0BE96|nr:outer membrane beta-barrel protein [Roseicyclus sp. Amp-Y-6]
MKRFAWAAAAAMTATAPAFAGGLAEPEPTPAAEIVPVVPAPPATDWTGFQAGVVLGIASTTTTFSPLISLDLDSNRYGVIARYLHDMGDFVLGGQLMYEQIEVENDVVTGMNRLGASVLVGYDMGRLLPYAHLGVTRLDTGSLGTIENGVSYGVGAMFEATDSLILSIEYSRTEYDDYLIPIGELSADSLRIAATFRF